MTVAGDGNKNEGHKRMVTPGQNFNNSNPSEKDPAESTIRVTTVMDGPHIYLIADNVSLVYENAIKRTKL
jgi:hypothetical protein